MKISLFPALIAVAVATLIGMFVANLCASEANVIVIGVATGVSLAVTLLPLLAFKTQNTRLDINIRTVSTIFASLVLLVNFIVCFNTPHKLIIYFIILGLIVVTYIGVLYSLVKSSE